MEIKDDVEKDTKNAMRVFFKLSVIIFGVWIIWSALNPPSKKAYNPYKTAHSEQIPGRVLMPPPNIDASTQNETETTDKEIEQWRADRSDLAAQWETADMAHLAFRMGILGVILIGWTIFETQTAADKTRDALRVAEETLQVTRRTAVNEQRAYLSLRLHEFTPSKQAGMYIFHFRVENHGKTPAYLKVVKCGYKIYPWRKRGKIFWPKDILSIPTVFPESHQFVKIEGRMDDDLLNSVIRKDFSAHAFGFLIYRDIFGITRRTMFHSIFDEVKRERVAQFTAYDRHNSAS